MKINYTRKTTIADLGIGDCFFCDNHKDCYMKICFAYVRFNDTGSIVNAVNLVNGDLYEFKPEEEVVKCDGVINIT